MGAVRPAAEDLILATSRTSWRYAALGRPGSAIRPLSALWTSRRVVAADEFEVAGWWGRLGRQGAAVFVRDGELRVAVARDEWPVDGSLQCSLRESDGTTSLRLQRDGAPLVAWDYRTPKPPREHWFDWPQEREDRDFGHFIVRAIDRPSGAPPLETIWPFPRRLRRWHLTPA